MNRKCIEISKEDQEEICEFSTIFARKTYARQILNSAKASQQETNDLIDELVLKTMEVEVFDSANEDTGAWTQIGQSYLLLPVNQGQTVADQKVAHYVQLAATQSAAIDILDVKLATLRSRLYGKFGTHINLDKPLDSVANN